MAAHKGARETRDLLGKREPRRKTRTMGKRAIFIWNLLQSVDHPMRVRQIHQAFRAQVGKIVASDIATTRVGLHQRQDLFTRVGRRLWTVRVRTRRERAAMPGSMVDDFSSAPRSYEGRESAERPLCSGDVELECTISLSVTVDTYGSATITHVNGRSLEPEAAAILLRALNRQALEELAQTELAEVEEAEDEPE